MALKVVLYVPFISSALQRLILDTGTPFCTDKNTSVYEVRFKILKVVLETEVGFRHNL